MWLFLQTCFSPKGTHSDPFRRETFQVWSVRLFLLSVWSSESTQAHSHWRTTLHLQSMQLLQQRFWQPSEARGKEAQRAGNCLKKRPVCLFWHYNAGIVLCPTPKENKDWFDINYFGKPLFWNVSFQNRHCPFGRGRGGCKDTINCPEKVMKICHFNQTNQRILIILR